VKLIFYFFSKIKKNKNNNFTSVEKALILKNMKNNLFVFLNKPEKLFLIKVSLFFFSALKLKMRVKTFS
jgi:hypothetical protein